MSMNVCACTLYSNRTHPVYYIVFGASRRHRIHLKRCVPMLNNKVTSYVILIFITALCGPTHTQQTTTKSTNESHRMKWNGVSSQWMKMLHFLFDHIDISNCCRQLHSFSIYIYIHIFFFWSFIKLGKCLSLSGWCWHFLSFSFLFSLFTSVCLCLDILFRCKSDFLCLKQADFSAFSSFMFFFASFATSSSASLYLIWKIFRIK